MEEISKEQDNKQDETVLVSVEMIQNMRNVLEVANSRINWKIEELLPVGVLIKQLDDVLDATK